MGKCEGRGPDKIAHLSHGAEAQRAQRAALCQRAQRALLHLDQVPKRHILQGGAVLRQSKDAG